MKQKVCLDHVELIAVARRDPVEFTKELGVARIGTIQRL